MSSTNSHKKQGKNDKRDLRNKVVESFIQSLGQQATMSSLCQSLKVHVDKFVPLLQTYSTLSGYALSIPGIITQHVLFKPDDPRDRLLLKDVQWDKSCRPLAENVWWEQRGDHLFPAPNTKAFNPESGVLHHLYHTYYDRSIQRRVGREKYEEIKAVDPFAYATQNNLATLSAKAMWFVGAGEKTDPFTGTYVRCASFIAPRAHGSKHAETPSSALFRLYDEEGDISPTSNFLYANLVSKRKTYDFQVFHQPIYTNVSIAPLTEAEEGPPNTDLERGIITRRIYPIDTLCPAPFLATRIDFWALWSAFFHYAPAARAHDVLKHMAAMPMTAFHFFFGSGDLLFKSEYATVMDWFKDFPDAYGKDLGKMKSLCDTLRNQNIVFVNQRVVSPEEIGLGLNEFVVSFCSREHREQHLEVFLMGNDGQWYTLFVKVLFKEGYPPLFCDWRDNDNQNTSLVLLIRGMMRNNDLSPMRHANQFRERQYNSLFHTYYPDQSLEEVVTMLGPSINYDTF